MPNLKSPEKFIIRKPYVIETWTDVPVEEKIAAYLEAFGKLDQVSPYYKNRLGQLYEENMSDDDDYRMKAIDVYSGLVEEEPENDLWNQILIRLIGDNPEELADIKKRSWELNKDDLGKAYSYAETCVKFKFYERAVEPLVHLTQKSPEVINYWRKLATVYTNLDQNDNAINAYKTLIELEPNNRENYYNLALIYKNLEQLSVARSYLQKASKASEEPWDLPLYLEAQLYEQAARDCGFEFEDRLVYQLAVDTYRRAAAIGGPNAGSARDRVNALSSSVPQQEDYFFRKISSGTVIKIEGKCYGWIGRSITTP
jgi:tetratricopeptide (TPR) repeat protein